MDGRDRDSILSDLRSADEEIRRLAVERLAALPAEEALPRLVEGLGDPGWRVRKAAVERLVAAPASWLAIDALIGALSDGENPGRRNAAAEALIRCGERAVDKLLLASHSEDVDVRKLAVDTLAGIGHGGARSRLHAMLSDPDTNVRGAAADALGAIGDVEDIPVLRGAATAGDDDRLVALSALKALARLEAPLSAAELAPALADPLLRPAAYAVLGRVEGDAEGDEILLKGLDAAARSTREAAVEALLRALSRRDGDAAERLGARIRETADERLVRDGLERLATADLATRLQLIQFFGLLDREEVVVPILLAGRDEALVEVAFATLRGLGAVAERAIEAGWPGLDAEGRGLACRVLAHTGGELGRRRLLACLDEPDGELRGAAARALGARRCGEALLPLVRWLEAVALRDGEPEAEDELDAAVEAVLALAAGEDAHPLRAQAVDHLSSRLDAASEGVRLALARVLGGIARSTDTDLVEWLLKDASPGVRKAAVQAMERFGPGAALDTLRLALADESPDVRIAAARALGASDGGHVVEDLERLADDPDARVRAATLRAIGSRAARTREAGDLSHAVDALGRALRDEGPVAIAALEGLGWIGGSRAGERAARLLAHDDPALVQAAVTCVGNHADREQLQSLLPLVAHDHWAVRAEAIQSLGERGLAEAVPTILRRLETEQDDFVRDAILRALRRLDG